MIYLATALLLASAGQHKQPQASTAVIERAIGDNWKEWREERQLAREDRIKAREERTQAAARIEDAIGMLQRLYWCGFALCVLVLIAVILYLVKPAFELVRGVLVRLGFIATLLVLVLATSANAQQPTPAINPNPAVKPAKQPESSVIRPDLKTSYADAYAKHKRDGLPLLVIVSATWCPPCQQIKRELQGHIDAGVLDGVALAFVDWDKENKVARQIVGDKALMPTVMFYWSDDIGKRSRRHVSYLNREGFRRLVKR